MHHLGCAAETRGMLGYHDTIACCPSSHLPINIGICGCLAQIMSRVSPSSLVEGYLASCSSLKFRMQVSTNLLVIEPQYSAHGSPEIVHWILRSGIVDDSYERPSDFFGSIVRPFQCSGVKCPTIENNCEVVLLVPFYEMWDPLHNHRALLKHGPSVCDL
jgi:hypothetical protein